MSAIAVFGHKRPDHLRRVIMSLAANLRIDSVPVYVFCDGSRNEAEQGAVVETIEYVRSLSTSGLPFRVTVVIRERNYGLSGSVIAGIDEVLRNHDSVIVLEDDTVVSSTFYANMANALERFRDDLRVHSIQGYCWPALGLPPFFFLRGAYCWGWATWRDRWNSLERDPQVVWSAIQRRNLGRYFDLEGARPMREMLQDRILGASNSWAILWYAAAILNDRVSLNFGKSLVRNIGLDGSGENCTGQGNGDSMNVEQLGEAVVDLSIGKIRVEEDPEVLRKMQDFFRSYERSRRFKLLRRIYRRYIRRMRII